MPVHPIPKPFQNHTPEQRKAILDNWSRFLCLATAHTDRFALPDHETNRLNLHVDRVGQAAADQLLVELEWKAALETALSNPQTD